MPGRLQIVGIVVAAVGTYICGPECGMWGYALIGASAGASNAIVNGADFAGVVQGAFTGAVLGAVGGHFAMDGISGLDALGFGAVGGIISELSGGDFGHGFISAGMGFFVGGQLGVGGTSGEIAGRTFVKTLVGGSLSELTGGKFANGAATAAFSSIVNEGVAINRARNFQPSRPTVSTPRITTNGASPLSNDFKLAWSTSVEMPPEGVAPIGNVPVGQEVSGLRITTTTSNAIGGSLGEASGSYGSDLVPGMPGRLGSQLQRQFLSAAAAPVVIGLNPGAALSGTAFSAVIDFGMGRPMTMQGLVRDAAISSAVAPIGFARAAGNHPVARSTDFLRTYSAGSGLESVLFGN